MIKIERDIVYRVNDYSYKNYVILTDEEKELVWNWRNHPEIRKWMTNSDIIPLQSHLNFIEGLKTRNDAYYWLVFKDGAPIATLNFTHINYSDNSGMPGLYLSPDELNTGEGFTFHYYYKELAYHQLGFEALKGGYVEVGNTRAFIMGSFWGGAPVSYFEENGKGYLELCGTKEEFDAIDKTHLLRDFTKFARENRKVDWDRIIKETIDRNER